MVRLFVAAAAVVAAGDVQVGRGGGVLGLEAAVGGYVVVGGGGVGGRGM